jgi:lipid II:glycine glycyltransferase (peptidoglycan interpeptide bridge formation enzyme)
MQVLHIDPLSDLRWQRFVDRHPHAGIFHTQSWLEALRRTYGYEAVAYVVTGEDQEVVSGIPFCRISSGLTGRRLVSLPFSDHCQPLIDDGDHLRLLLAAVDADVAQEKMKYFELRPLELDYSQLGPASLAKSHEAVLHRLNISQSLDEIMKGFNKSNVLRKIRSERNDLRLEEGRSESLLDKFYGLLLLTRRKHQLPPQPRSWFSNLIDCMQHRLTIRVLFKDDMPVASVLTLSFKQVVTYKYSCSDPQFNPLAGTVRLIWRVIQDAVDAGVTELDLGRSDFDTPGLITFKDHWGAVRAPLTYFRYPDSLKDQSANSAVAQAVRRLLSMAPDNVLSAVGGLLYRHVG